MLWPGEVFRNLFFSYLDFYMHLDQMFMSGQDIVCFHELSLIELIQRESSIFIVQRLALYQNEKEYCQEYIGDILGPCAMILELGCIKMINF